MKYKDIKDMKKTGGGSVTDVMKICKALRDKPLRVFFIVTQQAREESRRHNKSPTAVMPEKTCIFASENLKEALINSAASS